MIFFFSSNVDTEELYGKKTLKMFQSNILLVLLFLENNTKLFGRFFMCHFVLCVEYFSQHLGEYENVLAALEDLNVSILKAMDKTKKVSDFHNFLAEGVWVTFKKCCCSWNWIFLPFLTSTKAALTHLSIKLLLPAHVCLFF